MLRFEQVVKRFGKQEVLSGVSFEISKGEIFAIVGPSGTGKSVTLKHMVGLLAPTSGRVLLEETNISASRGEDLVRLRARFGYLFQGGALLGWLTVAENVALPLREGRVHFTEAEINQRVHEALDQVELLDAAERYPAEISGGMAKRAGLARVIVREADIILYDEPTSGLDPVTGATVNRLIRRLNEGRGLTSVVVTHDLASALLFADRIMMLKAGRVVALARPADFVHLETPEVREFLDAQFVSADFLDKRRSL